MIAGPQWKGRGEERGMEYVIQTKIKCRATDKKSKSISTRAPIHRPTHRWIEVIEGTDMTSRVWGAHFSSHTPNSPFILKDVNLNWNIEF
jgi:hypothetical protein